MAVAHAVAHIDEIEMGVDLHDVDRRLAVEGADAGDVDRMIAAEHDRQRAALEDLAHRQLDVGDGSSAVSVWTISASPISTMRTGRRQIDDVVLMVIGAAMAEREQCRGLADRARAEAGAGAVLRAHVVGNAEHRHVGVDRSQSRQIGRLPKVQWPTKGRSSRPRS